MTTHTISPVKKPRDLSPVFNRTLYIGFVLMACYFLIFSDDKMTGVSNLGIAMIFDPFDAKITWTKRPV